MSRLLRFLLVLPLLALGGCALPGQPAPTPIVSQVPTPTAGPTPLPSAGGRIAFVRVPAGQPLGALWIIRPDGSSATQIAVAQQVDSLPVWSPDGTHIVYQSPVNGKDQLFVVEITPDNSAGTTVLLTATQQDHDNTLPAWSPDGKQIVYQSGTGSDFKLYIMNANGSDRPRQIPELPPYAGNPVWSPDGSHIAFSGGASATVGREIYTTAPSGGPALRLTGNGRDAVLPHWSPDGKAILFLLRQEQSQFYDIYQVATDGSGQRAVAESSGVEENPAWSPDSQWVAFDSSRTNDVYVAPASGGAATNISNGPSSYQPTWAPDSTYLAFVSARSGHPRVYLADRNGGSLRALTPEDGDYDERFPVWSATSDR